MNTNIGSLLDYSEYTDFYILRETTRTQIIKCHNKNSPYQEYIFKTFKLNDQTSKDQKKILETFNQVNCEKSQYILRYTRYSFFSYDSLFHPTFSMKKIPSKTLDELFKDKTFADQWKLHDVFNCLFAISKGMMFLHSHLVYHGNLCPSNIVVDSCNQCYLCDFGLYPIKEIYYNDNELFNSDYKDPRIKDKEPSFRSDIYSFGVLVCQFCVTFFHPENYTSLNDFKTKFDKEKLKDLPPILVELIELCICQPYVKILSFQNIIDVFQNSNVLIDGVKVKKLFENFNKVIYVETLAKSNDHNALNKLGHMYEEGILVKKDRKKALQFYKEAANLGNSEAQNNYGVLLQEETIQKRINKGFTYLKMSAEQGNINGMANYAVALNDGIGTKKKDEAEVRKYLKKAADLGMAYAQDHYAFKLLNDIDPSPEQINEGFKYIKMSMGQNFPGAFYTYGIILYFGYVVDKNRKLANDYFKKAADMGYILAMNDFASSCLKGDGIEQNKELGLEYFKKSAKLGNVDAKKFLKEIEDGTYDYSIPDDDKNHDSKVQKINNQAKNSRVRRGRLVTRIQRSSENNSTNPSSASNPNDKKEDEVVQTNESPSKSKKNRTTKTTKSPRTTTRTTTKSPETTTTTPNKRVGSRRSKRTDKTEEEVATDSTKKQNNNDSESGGVLLAQLSDKSSGLLEVTEIPVKRKYTRRNLKANDSKKEEGNQKENNNNNENNITDENDDESDEIQKNLSFFISNENIIYESQNTTQPLYNTHSSSTTHPRNQAQSSNSASSLNQVLSSEGKKGENKTEKSVDANVRKDGMAESSIDHIISSQEDSSDDEALPNPPVKTGSSGNRSPARPQQSIGKHLLMSHKSKDESNKKEQTKDLQILKAAKESSSSSDEEMIIGDDSDEDESDEKAEPNQAQTLPDSSNSDNEPLPNTQDHNNEEHGFLSSLKLLSTQEQIDENESEDDEQKKKTSLHSVSPPKEKENSNSESSLSSSSSTSSTSSDEENENKSSSTDDDENNDEEDGDENEEEEEYSEDEDDSNYPPSLPPGIIGILKRGDRASKYGNTQEATSYYEIAASNGYPQAYIKIASMYTDIENQNKYYLLAIKNNVPDAFSQWRKKILQFLDIKGKEKDCIKYAKQYEAFGDYSDAAYAYHKAKDYSNYKLMLEKAKQNIDDIKDGMQQFQFGKLLEITNETGFALLMYRKAFENGILAAERRIKNLESKIK